MIYVFDNLSDMQFAELMCVYAEGNEKNACELYGKMDINAAILTVEQDFYQYLSQVFFPVKNAKYFVWVEKGKYVSALRMEPYEEGLLLEALETRPEYRMKGYASTLLRAAIASVDLPVYSHVLKDNFASIKTHLACGFEVVSDSAKYIDGTTNADCYTLVRKMRV